MGGYQYVVALGTSISMNTGGGDEFEYEFEFGVAGGCMMWRWGASEVHRDGAAGAP